MSGHSSHRHVARPAAAAAIALLAIAACNSTATSTTPGARTMLQQTTGPDGSNLLS